MANIIRIKRRATGGAAGAPTSLATSELATTKPTTRSISASAIAVRG